MVLWNTGEWDSIVLLGITQYFKTNKGYSIVYLECQLDHLIWYLIEDPMEENMVCLFYLTVNGTTKNSASNWPTLCLSPRPLILTKRKAHEPILSHLDGTTGVTHNKEQNASRAATVEVPLENIRRLRWLF